MGLFGNYVPFKQDIERYISNCKTVFESIGDHASASLVEGFIKDMERQRYNITMVGGLKRGKSTLLNTLMERRNDFISPIATVVCTSAIIKYIDKNIAGNADQTEKAKIYFDGPENPPVTISFSQLKNYVTEEYNPGNRKHVRSVEVYGDFPAWSKAVTIIDSPGQNSVFDYHDILLSDFLPFTDAIIFLVAADLPLDGGDLALLKELSNEQKKKIFFVVSKIDNIGNPDDLSDTLDFIQSEIQKTGLPCEKLYPVAAKPVYEALVAGISGNQLEALKSEHGIAELENDLEKFIVAESPETKVLRDRIETLLNKTSDACNSYLAESNNILNKKEYDITKLQTEQADLKDKNQELRENTQKALKKFGRQWDRIINSFDRKFSSKAGAIEDRIIDRLGRGGLVGAAFQSFKLKKQVQQAVELELQPLVLDLEEKLDEVITTLNNEFDEDLDLYVKRGSKIDIGAVAGSAAASLAMGGTVCWGFMRSSAAVTAVTSAFGKILPATENATLAQAKMAGAWGILKKAAGTSTAQAAKKAGAMVTNAKTAAVFAGLGSIANLGLSIAVNLIVGKLLHIVLVNVQESRVSGITGKVMEDTEAALFKSLDKYKESIIQEYQQRIDDIISDRQDRLEEIKDILSNDDSSKRQLVIGNMGKVRGLLDAGTQIQKQIPTLL